MASPIVLVVTLWLALLEPAAPAAAQEPPSSGIDAALCRLIDAAATGHGVPPGFLTRLIFQESSFRSGVTSPAGAQGVAQFMPGTARERGLADPFDPEQAIPKAAQLLADLKTRFGNWGLAAAAYNGGPARVASWFSGRGGLPFETETYVLAITGAAAEDWADDARSGAATRSAGPDANAECAVTVAAIRGGRAPLPAVAEAAFAPWGVQLAGNFVKARALSAFQRSAGRYRAILGEARPMVIGTRLRSRGTRAFYRVRLPAQTRAEATALCGRIRERGGACVVLKS
ncbi:MAG: lytic transglycosylase domain-containing protein [Beijerinckiaceae bacterium]|nr:lytic transglycosylase domain-containing protein [Beijerinckiaceae bacterium]